MADINSVLGIIDQAIQANQGQAAALTSAYGGIQGGIGAQSRAGQDMLEAQKIRDRQALEGTLAAQNNTRAAASALGTNMDDIPTEIVSILGSAMREEALKVAQQSARVQDIESNNDLFSSPLGFLRDLAVGDQARAELAGSQARLESLSKSLGALNQATQSTALTQKAIAETTSEASIQAEMDMLAAQQRELAAKAATNSSKASVDMLNSLNSLNSQNTRLALEAYNLQNQAEQQAFYRDLQSGKGGDKAKADALLTQYANLARAEKGLTPVESSALESAANPELEDFLVRRGQTISMAAQQGIPTPALQYGSNPIAAMSVRAALGDPTTSAEMATVQQQQHIMATASNPSSYAKFLRDTGQNLDAAGKTLSTQELESRVTELLKTKEGRAQAASQVWDYQVSQFKDNPGLDTSVNPYAFSPMNVLKDWEALRTEPFLMDKVAPLIQAAVAEGGSPAEYNPDYLAKAALDSMKSGKANSNDLALQLAGIANQLMLYNNSARNYVQNGMPAQSKSEFRVTVPGFSDVIDTSNPAEWNDFLVKAAVSVDTGRAGEFFDSIPSALTFHTWSVAFLTSVTDSTNSLETYNGHNFPNPGAGG